MNLADNDFELFELTSQFALDRVVLDQRWRDMQGRVHPDRFADQGAAAQRVAMQWAVRVNEAYQRLKDPVTRAAYLCEMHGVPIDAETNTAMPIEFLSQQMEWREALEACEDIDSVEALALKVSSFRQQALQRLEQTLDVQRDHATAAAHVRRLMFVDRFAQDIDRRLESLEP